MARTKSSDGLITAAGSMLAGRLAVAGLSWFGTALIARQLDQSSFGQFTLVFSVLGMMSIVTDLGLGRIAITQLARVQGSERADLAGTYLVLRFFLGLVGYGLALAVVWVAGYPDQVIAATAVAGLVVLAATPSHAYDVAFQLHHRLPGLAAVSVFGQLAQIALTVALVLHGGSVVWFTVPAVLNEAVQLIWKVPAAHRLMPFRYHVDLDVWRRLLRHAGPLTIGSAFVTLYYRVDAVMLASLDAFAAVGVYGVAYKFVDLMHFLPSALTVALMAPLTQAWDQDRQRFRTLLTDASILLLVAVGAALVGLLPFADEAAALLYGGQYAAAGDAVRVLALAESIGFFSALAVTVLLVANGHRRYPLIAGAGLVVNVVANLILIPPLSFIGAAWTTLLTEFIVGVLLWRLVSVLDLGSLVTLRTVAVFGLAVAAGASVAFGLGQQISWIVAVIIAELAFLGVVSRLPVVRLAIAGSRPIQARS